MGSTVTHDLRGYFCYSNRLFVHRYLIAVSINPFEMSLQLMFPVLFLVI